MLFREEPSTQLEVDESGDLEEVDEDSSVVKAGWDGIIDDLEDSVDANKGFQVMDFENDVFMVDII